MATRDEVAARLDEVSLYLRDEYEEFGSSVKKERRAKAAAFRNGCVAQLNGKSLSTTDLGRYIDSETVDDAASRIDHEHRIKEFEEERDHLRFMVKYGLEEFVSIQTVGSR